LKYDLREIRILSELKSDFVVQYFDSWIESSVELKQISKYLFMKLELCEQNLKEIFILIDLMDEKFKTLKLFISFELFRELTKAVNSLHSNQPKPIMHRDLKPENVLISDGRNGVFLKLCDFGLAIPHEIEKHTAFMGTQSYMAPEVRYGEEYGLKSDIFGLALIGTEIFRFEDNVMKFRGLLDRNKM
jgi:serine/threonine protein kinase